MAGILLAAPSCGSSRAGSTPAADRPGTGTAADGDAAGPSSAENLDASAAPATSAGGPGLDAGTAPGPSSYMLARQLVGAYAGKIAYRKVLSAGTLGEIHALATISASIEIKAVATTGMVTVSTRPCHVEIVGTGTGLLAGATVTIPDIVMTTTQLDDATLSSVADAPTGIGWSISEIHGPIGWKWAGPGDTQPTAATDPRVFDQDGDGEPGVTMMVNASGINAKLYFVQTERDALRGTLGDAGELTGETSDDSQQAIIGSDNQVLAQTAISWSADTNTVDNTVRIVPVPKMLACSELLAQIETLFPN
ncbi:MAG TPA: hypothetical protein VK762_10340 [Polyangiaceae bacterium]|nr:hypothetical protein [Polyangiaceae bacterium]